MDNSNSQNAAKIVPLLGQLQRLEELLPSLVMRLDPIIDHNSIPGSANATPPSSTVTGRLEQLGDTLQYLLDHIEL